MDFFDQQDVARKKTGRLVLLFIVAIVVMVLAIYVIFTGLFIGVQVKSDAPAGAIKLFRPAVFFAVAVATVGIIGLGSLFKIVQLRGGGKVVAESLGGRLLPPNTTDHLERKVLNVVEEMAIASGTPVPPVYMMDNEPGINAFAAGYSPEDAVIGVTRGCCQQLSRDQLQGVMAHEFSHILNGDMRLNIRLMGIVHGILVIGLIGHGIMRMSYYSGSSRRSRDGGGGKIIILGIALLIIGYAGMFFGRLIKAAVSRQREFLADASAVQFTRNPDGIAGALKVIGGYSEHSAIQASHAEECSHMFFGSIKEGVANFSSLATHPPIAERIKRVDPSFAGELAEIAGISGDDPGRANIAGFAGGSASPRSSQPPPLPSTPPPLPSRPSQGPITADSVTNAVGTIDPDNLNYVRELVAAIPEQLRAAAREPFGARALVYALLLDDDAAVRNRQLQHLERHAEADVHLHARHHHPLLQHTGRAAYLPLADLAIPALRQIGPTQYEAFRANVEALVHADGCVDLFEYALEHLLVRNLDREFRQLPPTPTRYYSLKPFSKQLGILLSALAHAGATDNPQAASAFRAGVKQLGNAVDGTIGDLRPAADATLDAIDDLLPKLDQLSPREKRRIIGAAAVAIAADGAITVAEAELLRAVADALSCPLPPLLTAA